MEKVEEPCKIIYKDYSEKIKSKIPENSDINCNDINSLIALLNYCFQKKNNFFITNFNKRVIRNIYVSYNQIKTNILTPEIDEIFYKIDYDNIKLLRFIIINFVNNFEIIINKQETNELCDYVSKDSMKHCLHYLNNILNQTK